MAKKNTKKQAKVETNSVGSPRVAKAMAAQGDVMFIRVDSMPPVSKLKEVKSPGTVHVVAHSETGHHHTVRADAGRFFQDPSDPNVCYLQLADSADFCDVIHNRDFHTHAPIRLEGLGGSKIWKIQRQQEDAGDGIWRQVND